MIELTTTNAGPILDKFDIVLTEETGALADEIYKVDLEIALQNAAKELAPTDVYTEDSVAALAEAQSAAQAVFDDDTATQAEVDEKLEALENAMEGLEYPTFNITTSVEANTGGTITSSADSVERGESVNITITPAYGYIAKKLTVNGNEVASDSSETTTFYGPNRTYSISNITEDQEVSVTFEKTGYTEEEPFEFPTGTEPVTLEAEDFTLYNAGQLSEKWKLSVSSATWDNQTVQFINCLNSGDSISVPYRAEAGTYDVTAYYRSGSDSNQLIWSSEGDKITAGSANAGSADKNSSVTRNTTFTVTVAEGGAGVWTFTAPSGNSPQLDRLVITKQGTPEPQTYTVTARVEGGNGTITPESREVNAGESVEFTITPNEGYEIADVQVDSTSVLGQVENGKYTLTDINANTEVVVSFKEIPAAPEQYTEENPFQFPTELNGTPVTLEAERFILNNTGTDEEWEIQVSDADWASNKQYVNAMNAGDSITLHYYAEKAGIYQATLQYRSGDTRNSMTWAEAEGKIENGSLPSVEQGDSTTAAVVLTWEVTTPGAGVLTFTAGEMNAPQLDKFDIRLIEETGTVTPVEYAITAEPAENGSVTVSAEKVAAGESVTYTAAAAEGYVIDSIEVNGAAVADVSGNVSYEGTIDNIQENIIIRATFKAAAATQPDKSVLEAELITSETILTQTDKYTEESLTAYNAAVTAARAVFDDPNATQEQINAAVQNLTDAANLLVENTTDPNPGTGEQDPSGTGEQELPGTGGQGSSGTGGQGSSGTTALSDTQKPSGSSTGTVRAAQSGDEYSPILWIVVLAAECAAGGVVIRLRMKK